MENLKALVSGRMDRRTYAIATVLYLLLSWLVLMPISPFLAQFLAPPVWILFAAAPRLRDMGWSPWWAVTPFAAGFVSGFVGKAANLDSGAAVVLGGVLTLVTLGFMIILAVMKGRGSTIADRVCLNGIGGR